MQRAAFALPAGQHRLAWRCVLRFAKLCVCVCVCACACVRAYVYVCVCMCVSVYPQLKTHMLAHMRTDGERRNTDMI